MLLPVSLDCSADGVSPPSGAIRNQGSIFLGSCGVTLIAFAILYYTGTQFYFVLSTSLLYY